MYAKPRPTIYCKESSSLLFDEACLHVYSSNNHLIKLYYKLKECYKCDFLEWTNITSDSDTPLIVKTTDTINFYADGNLSNSCSQSFKFEQHGVYGWNVSNNTCSSVYVIKPPEDPYVPLYYFIGILLAYLALNVTIDVVYKTQCFKKLLRKLSPTTLTESGEETPTGDTAAPLVPTELLPVVRQLQNSRINSLDTFRGITIALMIFVNYGGGKYWFFEHSSWNGLTVADVIFPWFAWIMGVGIAISVRARLRSGLKRLTIIYGIHIRVAYLILLGLFISNLKSNDLTTFRLPGVLQRLGLSYLIVALMESLLMKRQPNFQYSRWVIFQDILEPWMQWIGIITIAGIHTAITFYLNTPGCPPGYLGPGGLQDHRMLENCTGGAAGYIDRHIFGDKHIYKRPSSTRVYHSTVPFDPEGLLGVLTTALTVYLGVAAGRVILCSNTTAGRIKRWICYSIICGIIAGSLCGWSKEGGIIPINKNLWSLSFVFATASLAFLMLIILYLTVDHFKLWTGAPLTHAGLNSILLYVGHGLCKQSFPFSFSPIDESNHNDFFIQNVVGSFLWIAIAHMLYRRNTFFTV